MASAPQRPRKQVSPAELPAEYQRLRDWAAAAEPGPGRTTTLGWDLEYPSPDVLVAFLEKEFDIKISDDEVLSDSLSSFAKIRSFVEAKVAQ